MRNRKAFLSVAVSAAAVLLATSSAVSQLAPEKSCEVGDVEFTVTSGPTFVPCDFGDGQCTEIEYQVVPPRETVYALQGKGVVGLSNGGEIFGPCEGVGGFGQGSCHQQAVAANPDLSGKFRITLTGVRRPSPTSVASSIDPLQACEILGVGLENSPNPDETVLTTETVDFKDCVVEFFRDAATGEVVRAQITRDSPEACTSPFLGDARTLLPQPVGDLEVKLRDGTSLGRGKFGDGYLSTGLESCTTRIIGGKVYTWGKPCP
jgi:hypothetical protein